MNSSGVADLTLDDQYIRYCEQPNLSDKAIEAYRWALSKLRPVDEVPLDPDQHQQPIANGDLADESRLDLWRRLRTFYRWAESRDLFDNVMVDVDRPRVRRQFPRVFTEGEIADLFGACLEPRDTTNIAVSVDAGMSAGELASMRWSHVTADGARVTGKTGDRFHPLTDQVTRLTAGQGKDTHMRIGRSGPVKLSRLKQGSRRVAHRAGILPPKAGAHTLRHTFGYPYVKHGGDPFSLRRLMGHSSIESTMLYVRMNNRDLIDQYRRFAPSKHIRFPS